MSTRWRENASAAAGLRKVRGWTVACRSLRRRWWSVIRSGAPWRCVTIRDGRMSRCWNRGCLSAGFSERRSVSRCWCWRPTLILEGGKARAVASSDTARCRSRHDCRYNETRLLMLLVSEETAAADELGDLGWHHLVPGFVSRGDAFEDVP